MRFAVDLSSSRDSFFQHTTILNFPCASNSWVHCLRGFTVIKALSPNHSASPQFIVLASVLPTSKEESELFIYPTLTPLKHGTFYLFLHMDVAFLLPTYQRPAFIDFASIHFLIERKRYRSFRGCYLGYIEPFYNPVYILVVWLNLTN